MGDIELDGLPKCELLSILNEKAKNRHNFDIDLLGILNNLRIKISAEVRQINYLFPEYTPHDETYHLKHLFYLADKILGENRLKLMNPAELFVLAIGLYSHDWGMAVSIPEKTYITSGKLIEGTLKEDLWILSDDQNRYKDFLSKHCWCNPTEASGEEPPIELWREYVRQTHAFRSAERVRRFFEPIDRSIAKSAAKVCEGHCLEFEELQDSKRYPASISAMGESINLRALTVYVRLIDLLDLAEDRTPYVLWKFVAPNDPKSKMEWAKHRALNPVTFPPYQEGRIIQVDGSTNDQNVYAELEDLRTFCEEQLKGCNNLLAQMNDPHHRLDLYDINWNVEAIGFNKTSIRFEFDRSQMFKFLSEEIYQNDPYVFLRELLQNSIDAIRMRREILQKQLGSKLRDFGIIKVNVDQEANGDIIVTWCDNGIGMDENIVSNYLAKIGKSYYGSRDFKVVGLKMDPISRFGIGILSCFTVADRIEIETFKDPYLPPKSPALKISIPDKKRYFRIEETSSNTSEPGTKVRVFIGKKLIKNNNEKEQYTNSLDITKYLSIVAGFVEFPILVKEGNRKAIIVNPTQKPNALRERFGEDFEVFQLNLSYPWSDSILPQDLTYALGALKEEKLDIASDLALGGYEGVLRYLVPISDDIDILYGNELRTICDSGHKYDQKRIRIQDDWNHLKNQHTLGLSRSSSYSNNLLVYKDGILIPSASPPPLELWDLSGPRFLPAPRLVVNITNSKLGTVNLSRTELKDEGEHWAKPIFEAFIKYILDKYKDELLAMGPIERAYKLGRISIFHNISLEKIWEGFPHNNWPLIFLDSGGEITGEDWVNISEKCVNLFPLHDDTGTFLSLSKKSHEWFDELFGKWIGERVLIQNMWHGFPNSVAGTRSKYLCDIPLEKFHFFGKIRFLQPPWEGNPPMLQKILCPIMDIKDCKPIEALLEIAVDEPNKLTLYENHILNKFLRKGEIFDELLLAEAIEFPRPFNESFAFGGDLLNRSHPGGEALFRFRAAVALSRKRKDLSAEQLGKLSDALNNFDKCKKAIHFDYGRFSSSLSRMFVLAKEFKLLELGDNSVLIPKPEDFVPGTLETFYDNSISFKNNKLDYSKMVKVYGNLI